ncbi:unnamed protein product [Rotaria socialis]|uniref:Uncharacterized protein n=1 Tax=Rotaria socialis TaxID=392032 RepID=A0A818NP72_9BILA|nr:unnamed protein product [Rotaria socialis]
MDGAPSLKAEQKELAIDFGQYSWPFQIVFLVHLPPFFNQPATYPHIRSNLTENLHFKVFPMVGILQNVQCPNSTISENRNRKAIAFKGTLNKANYSPGETAILKAEIENPKRILIQQVNISMF